jgi:tetratricopeptide (TPR) repeat protein
VRLDGIPLAIELAAAWVRSMNVEDINARLDHRFRLLVGGDRSALPRQQTLRSLIDWSYELLDSAEKEFLARLSVFAGGWPLEAAERICGGKGIGEVEVFDLLTGLVDKSLVVAEFSPTGTRYSILETVRQYGRDRLREHGSEELWRDRHATYFVSLAEIACPQLRGGNQRIWLDRMEAEHDNLRSVLAWSLEGHRDIEAGLRLAGSIWSFWSVRGHHGEALRWLTELFEANHGLPETANLAKALVGAGYISTHRLGASAGRTYYERSLAIAKSLCDEPAIAECLNGLGIVALAAQELTLAASHYTEALAIFRKLDDKRHVAVGLVNLGEVMRDQGDLELARSTFEEGLSVYRELGNRSGTAYSLNYLGLLALDRGDTRKARSLLRESLSMFLELDDRLWISHSLERLGEVAREEGDFAAARSLTIQCLDNMVVLGDRSGIALSLGALATIEFRAGNEERFAILSGASDRIYEELGAAPNSFIQVPAEFAEFWQEGRRMALEMAVKFAKEI